MKNLDEAIAKICELKGEALGMQAMINSILRATPEPLLAKILLEFDRETEIARVTLLNNPRCGEPVLDGFEAYVQRVSSIRRAPAQP